MRTFLYAVLFVMLAQPVWGNTLGPTYQNCKAFAEAEFNMEAMRPDYWQAIACVTYVGGVVDLAQAICKQSPDPKTRSLFGMDPGPLDLYAVIQSLINFC